MILPVYTKWTSIWITARRSLRKRRPSAQCCWAMHPGLDIFRIKAQGISCWRKSITLDCQDIERDTFIQRIRNEWLFIIRAETKQYSAWHLPATFTSRIRRYRNTAHVMSKRRKWSVSITWYLYIGWLGDNSIYFCTHAPFHSYIGDTRVPWRSLILGCNDYEILSC
jgi:hypothetical protein